MSSLSSASKEDITLSLGTKWSNAVEEKERQGQVIAHLTNQLEALKSAYIHDVEQVSATKLLLDKMADEMDVVLHERDEWKAAYNGVANQRIERDELVENLLKQLQTLESTTREEEVRASEEAKKSALLAKEKELLFQKFDQSRKEVDELYTNMAAMNDALHTSKDKQSGLEQAVEQLTVWRAAKDSQVASLVREKMRLFRLVTELRSTVKSKETEAGAAAGGISKGHKRDVSVLDDLAADFEAADSQPTSARSSSRGRPSSAASSSAFSAAASSSSVKPAVAARSGGKAATPLLLGVTVAGTHDRPAWSQRRGSGTKSRREVGPRATPLTSEERLAQLSLKGSINSQTVRANKARRESTGLAATQGLSSSSHSTLSTSRQPQPQQESKSNGSTQPSSPRSNGAASHRQQHASEDVDLQNALASPSASAAPPRPSPTTGERRRLLAGTVSSSDDDEDAAASASRPRSASARYALNVSVAEEARLALAKKNLIARLKRSIELLEEKNAELERALVLTREDNSSLLTRFRAAHAKAAAAERKLADRERELEGLRSFVQVAVPGQTLPLVSTQQVPVRYENEYTEVHPSPPGRRGAIAQTKQMQAARWN